MNEEQIYNSHTLSDMVFDDEYPSDQTTVLVTLHVSTEYWLDCLFRARCLLSEDELEIFDLSYARKIKLLYKLKMIPEHIHYNLNSLNLLRNRFVHQAGYCLGTMAEDFNFKSDREDFSEYRRISELPLQQARPPFWWRKALVSIINSTIQLLEHHCVQKLDTKRSQGD